MMTLDIGFLHPNGSISTAFVNSLLGLCAKPEFNQLHQVECGPDLEYGRNHLVKKFLGESDSDWLLQVDADMTFPRSVVGDMLKWADKDEVPILSGLAFCYDRVSSSIYPSLWMLNDEMRYDTYHDYPRDELFPVDAVGAFGLLVHRRVYEKVEHPFRSRSVRPLGEDLAFCANAHEEGFPVHVHSGIRFGHMKPMEVNEATYDAFRSASVLQP